MNINSFFKYKEYFTLNILYIFAYYMYFSNFIFLMYVLVNV